MGHVTMARPVERALTTVAPAIHVGMAAAIMERRAAHVLKTVVAAIPVVTDAVRPMKTARPVLSTVVCARHAATANALTTRAALPALKIAVSVSHAAMGSAEKTMARTASHVQPIAMSALHAVMIIVMRGRRAALSARPTVESARGVVTGCVTATKIARVVDRTAACVACAGTASAKPTTLRPA
jgi:hypothetical protein